MSEVEYSITAKKINSVALKLFSQEGYYNTSIRKIANEAGIALGLMYSYYQNKEALLKSMIREGIALIKAAFKRKVQNPTTPASAIRTIYTVLSEHQEHWKLLQMIRMQSSLKSSLHSEIQEIHEFFLSELNRILQICRVADPLCNARLIWAATEGVFMQDGFLPDEEYPAILDTLGKRFS